MRILHQTPSPWPQGYSAPGISSWLPGEVREVDAAGADYLTSTFPEAFVEHHDPRPTSRVPTTMPPESYAEDSVAEPPKKRTRRTRSG